MRPVDRRGLATDPGAASRRGPGPSKLIYRLRRAWAKPIVRNAILVYLPLAALAAAGWRVAANDAMRGQIEHQVAMLVERIAARPEFAVKGVDVTGGSEELNAEVKRTTGVVPGMSSLKLDVGELRQRIEDLGAVERATVQFDSQGVLRVAVVERIPVVLFRRADGLLVLLDDGGVEIGPAGARSDHPALPVLLGDGAQERVPEALELLAAASDIAPRLRALVRVGERRWDFVLDRDMVIKLPQKGAVDALSRVMALHYGEELLDRGVAVVDMRVPERPALQMAPEAAETYQIRKVVSLLGGKDT